MNIFEEEILNAKEEADRINMEFVRVLKERRKAMKVSQQQLADAIGINQSLISMIENGERKETALHTMIRLLNALGVKIVFEYDREY